MKKVLLAFSCIILFAQCKEHDTPIDFTHSGSTAGDTTYLLSSSAVPAADAHQVLIEEFTGASCSNCPAAHTLLQSIEATGNVNVVSLYITNFPQTDKPAGAVCDFRHESASTIGNNIYGGIYAMPLGGVDRMPLAGTILLGKADWTSMVNSQKLISDSVNIRIGCSWSGGVATIVDTVTYLYPMSTVQNLSIMITEDGMVDKQETPTGFDNAYIFTNVFRDMITTVPLGEQILPTMATKEKGRVSVRKFTWTPNATVSPAINAANCSVVAFVNAPGGTSGDLHVLQSAKIKLVP